MSEELILPHIDIQLLDDNMEDLHYQVERARNTAHSYGESEGVETLNYLLTLLEIMSDQVTDMRVG